MNTVNGQLTHSRPIFIFYTPWKYQKTFGFWCFQGYKMGSLARNELSTLGAYFKSEFFVWAPNQISALIKELSEMSASKFFTKFKKSLPKSLSKLIIKTLLFLFFKLASSFTWALIRTCALNQSFMASEINNQFRYGLSARRRTFQMQILNMS